MGLLSKEISKVITPTIEKLLSKKGKRSKGENVVVGKAAKKVNLDRAEFIKQAKRFLKNKKVDNTGEFGDAVAAYKPRNPNPKLINDPGNVAPKNKRELALLKASQALDDAGTPLKSGRELMTKEQYLNSNAVEKQVGAGSGPNVGGAIMRGKAVTRDQVEDLERMDREGNISIRKRGGTVKRNKGGAVRGVGAATRGFGNATYSNKPY